MSAAKPSGSFKFKKNATIGAADAEKDNYFLERCFVDTGDLDVIENLDNPKKIIIGRTGSGKTALLKRLVNKQQNVITVSPFDVAIEYIANSPAIAYLSENGVNFTPFYKLLWRHVFMVALIKHIHKIDDEPGFKNYLLNLMVSTSKKKQYNYLAEEPHFWKDPEEQIKEKTRKTEKDIKAAVKDIPGVDLSGGIKVSEEAKSEFVHKGREVVKSIKLKMLSEIIELVKAEIDDACDFGFYIVIDKLDDDWTEDSLRYKLIDALIATVDDFNSIGNLKVVICLRTDLIGRVAKQIKGAGYQEEKLRTLFLHLRWSDKELIELLDKRINQLVRDSYTLATITHTDLLPSMGRQETAIEYMLDRTMKRPRDIIQFFNYCIEQAVDNPTITKAMLLRAEERYSDDRLTSLEHEWKSDYPELPEIVSLFKKFPEQFPLSHIDSDAIIEFCAKFIKNKKGSTCPLAVIASDYYNATSPDEELFRGRLAEMLYTIGFLGIKTDSYRSMQWAGPDPRVIPYYEINDNMLCAVHKMYWRALGITHGRKRQSDEE